MGEADGQAAAGARGGTPGQRLAGAALIVLAAAAVAELALVAGFGNGRLPLVEAHYPKRQILFAYCAFAAGLFLREAAWRSRRAIVDLAGRMALLLFGLGASWLAAEAGLRIYLAQVQSRQSIARLGAAGKQKIQSSHPLAAIVRLSADPDLFFELTPGLDMEFGHTRLRTNSRGMRQDTDYPEAKPPGVVRVVGIGDSGMFGWAVEQNENYMAVLETVLNARGDGSRYEILNLGVPGYNTQLEIQSLRSKGLAYEPDIVVVGWCDNDFQVPFFIPQQGQWTRLDTSLLYYLLFDRTRYADLALGRVTDQRDFERERIPTFFRESGEIEGVRRAFEDLKGLAARHGFKVVVFGRMRDEAVEILREVGLPYFNTKERIPVGKYPEDYYVYFMHPRPGGHRALAEELTAELERLGWIPPLP